MVPGSVGLAVQPFPEAGDLSADPDLSGHLWIQELPTGGPLRFRVADTGLLALGTREASFDAGGDVPPDRLRATRHVRESLDVDALRAATADPASITFFGVATRYEGVDYDWDRLAPFVGVDAWSPEREGYLPPDAAAAAFQRLGLAALPAVAKEIPVEHASLEDYADGSVVPASAWYDGPAAGVLVRDKSGGRARAWHPAADRPDPLDASPTELAERFATDERIRRSVAALPADEPTVEAALERVLADVAREAYASLFRDGELVAEERAFRSAVAERVRRYLEG